MGTGRAKKRRLPAERQREFITGQIGQYLSRKAADVALVNHPKIVETITNQSASWMQSNRTVNGAERHSDWNAVNWRRANQSVRNLRQRIFRATARGDLKKVRSLQKLMLRSHSNLAVSVRKVTQVNAGKNTPGVDKLVIKTPEARAELVKEISTLDIWRTKPARRIYIPKANGKLRPLGIPVIKDRCLQAMVKNALEPEWEAKFEGISYGFRPGRSCHDAIAKIYSIATPNKRKRWVVDADIKGAFDHTC